MAGGEWEWGSVRQKLNGFGVFHVSSFVTNHRSVTFSNPKFNFWFGFNLSHRLLRSRKASLFFLFFFVSFLILRLFFSNTEFLFYYSSSSSSFLSSSQFYMSHLIFCRIGISVMFFMLKYRQISDFGTFQIYVCCFIFPFLFILSPSFSYFLMCIV